MNLRTQEITVWTTLICRIVTLILVGLSLRLPNALRVSRAATLPKPASVRSASHYPSTKSYRGGEAPQ
jgi:hypothetical protein